MTADQQHGNLSRAEISALALMARKHGYSADLVSNEQTIKELYQAGMLITPGYLTLNQFVRLGDRKPMHQERIILVQKGEYPQFARWGKDGFVLQGMFGLCDSWSPDDLWMSLENVAQQVDRQR